MQITKEQILMGRKKWEELTPQEQKNITILVSRINLFFKDYQWPLPKTVNDGLRVVQGSGAPQSNHFKGAAVDMDDDAAGTVWKYVWANRKRLKEIGLWMEHPCWTHANGMSWLHFQIVPPKSGNRFYVPNTEPNPNPDFWDGKYEKELNGF